MKVLVTGTNSGFGALITRTLVDADHHVVATMRDTAGRNTAAADELRSYAAGKTGSVTVLDLDVTDEGSVSTACAAAGTVDVLVNNAGAGAGGLAEAFTPAQYARIFDINVLGPQRTMRAVLPGMRARGAGLVINVSSIMGRLVIPCAGPYTVSKWALEGLTENYRLELLGTGVEVVSLEPGGFPTDFAATMAGPDDEARAAGYGPRAGLPEQVWAPFMELLGGDGAPDPQLVADEVLRLVKLPAGERPARVVVDPLTGGEAAEQINAVSDAVQAEVTKMLGLEG